MTQYAGSQANQGSPVVHQSPAVEIAPSHSHKQRTRVGDWQVILVRSRVDAINLDAFIDDIEKARRSGAKFLALDLKANRFLSFQAIQHCVKVADEMVNENGGLALICCAEKTKRHFEIYGSLNHIHVVRSSDALAALSGVKSDESTTVRSSP